MIVNYLNKLSNISELSAQLVTLDHKVCFCLTVNFRHRCKVITVDIDKVKLSKFDDDVLPSDASDWCS